MALSVSTLFPRTGAAAMAVTMPVLGSTIMHLKEIRLWLSDGAGVDVPASGSENFRVFITSANEGDAYNERIMVQDMEALSSARWSSEISGTYRVAPGDTVNFVFANSDASTWGLIVWFQKER